MRAGQGDTVTLPCVVRARARCPVASGVSGVSGMSESVEIAHSKATARACLTVRGSGRLEQVERWAKLRGSGDQ